jgi:hypothetical protein
VTNIKGNYISIEEMPFGCVVNDTVSGSHVVIGDLEDVDLLISSLQRLKADWYGDSDEN